MRSYELLRDVFKITSPKKVADDMNLSLSMIYKWAQPPETENGSGTINPLDRIDQLIQSTQDARMAQWISERAGGFHIENPEAKWPHPFYLIPATNKIVQEFAGLLSVIACAASDNHISADESVMIRKTWEQLKSVTEGFVQCCEEGNFGELKEELTGKKK